MTQDFMKIRTGAGAPGAGLRKAIEAMQPLLNALFCGFFALLFLLMGGTCLYVYIGAKEAGYAFLLSGVGALGLALLALRGCVNEAGNFRSPAPEDPSAPQRLHTYLDKIGFPWLSSRACLQERYGIKPHAAYSWDVIEVKTPRPFVKGLIWPLSFHCLDACPDLPAVEFSGHSSYGNNPRKNLRRTVKELTPFLGKGTPDGMGHRWDFGAASVQLIVWESDRNGRTHNPAHEREPKLRAACHITVNTGYRPPLNAADLALLRSFVPIAQIPQAGISKMPSWLRPAPEGILEFVRLPQPESDHIQGRVGCSSGRSALIFFNDELVILPMADILQFEVQRVLPAKGGGGAWLSVKCRCSYRANEEKSVPLCSASGPEDLNEFVAMLSAATDKPYVLGIHSHDC